MIKNLMCILTQIEEDKNTYTEHTLILINTIQSHEYQ